MTTTEMAAQGRWREVLLALGIPMEVLNGKNQPCPMCGGKDRFRFTDVKGNGNYYCNQCGAGWGVTLLMGVHGWDFKHAADEVDKIIGNFERPPPPREQRSLPPMKFDHVSISRDDPVARYLAARGVTDISGPWPQSLAYVKAMKHKPNDVMCRGMVAAFCDADGHPATVHRTFLTSHGQKAPVTPCRMFVPGPVPSGGAIRLFDAAETMGIAEGIETALSAAIIFSTPVWAACSDQLLAKWQPPPEAKRIVIFGDNDASYAGQAAAYALAKRLVTELAVDVKIPEVEGLDWNDVLLQQQRSNADADANELRQ